MCYCFPRPQGFRNYFGCNVLPSPTAINTHQQLNNKTHLSMLSLAPVTLPILEILLSPKFLQANFVRFLPFWQLDYNDFNCYGFSTHRYLPFSLHFWYRSPKKPTQVAPPPDLVDGSIRYFIPGATKGRGGKSTPRSKWQPKCKFIVLACRLRLKDFLTISQLHQVL